MEGWSGEVSVPKRSSQTSWGLFSFGFLSKKFRDSIQVKKFV